MDPEFERETLSVEDDHWWYRGRRQILRDVIARLRLDPGTRILDAGCGSGRNMVELADFGEVTGIDISDYSAEVARARNVGPVEVGELSALPFGDATFGLVTTLDVIEHVDDDVEALREMRRVARPDGRLLVTVPAHPSLWSSHDVVNHHKRRYTMDLLLANAAAAGWAPEWTTYFNSLLLPAAAAYRLLERIPPRREGEPKSQLSASSGMLNTVLEKPLLAEARWIRKGRRIATGLSLLGVFRAAAGQPPSSNRTARQ